MYGRGKDVYEEEEDGRTILFAAGRSSYFSLNAVGTAIWSLLETPTSLESLVKALSSRFAISEDECRLEVKSFLDKLIDQGVVVMS